MANDDFVLPRDTASFGPSRPTRAGFGINPDLDNLFLAFYRLVPRDLGNHKSDYLRALAGRWGSSGDAPGYELTQALTGRQEARLASLEEQGWGTEALKLKTASRLASGLGYDNAFEVGMTLHPLYGVPYLPGTAVKGVARTWAEEADAKAGADDILTVFGSRPDGAQDDDGEDEKQLGAVRFFDALPLGGFPALEVDVMTPHYSDYYRSDGAEPPGDWQDPTPIPFLAVAAGQPFRFALAARDDDALQKARRWLREGLRHLGIGGKTSAGYGVFWSEEDRQKMRQELDDAAQKAEQKQREAALPDRAERVGKRTTGLLARVIGPSRRRGVKLLVELHAEGYEDRQIAMTGRFNPDGFDEGEWIEVDVEQFSNGSVTLVRYSKRF